MANEKNEERKAVSNNCVTVTHNGVYDGIKTFQTRKGEAVSAGIGRQHGRYIMLDKTEGMAPTVKNGLLLATEVRAVETDGKKIYIFSTNTPENLTTVVKITGAKSWKSASRIEPLLLERGSVVREGADETKEGLFLFEEGTKLVVDYCDEQQVMIGMNGAFVTREVTRCSKQQSISRSITRLADAYRGDEEKQHMASVVPMSNKANNRQQRRYSRTGNGWGKDDCRTITAEA